MIILSAPFGNYLNWLYCTSTLGTFTREYRGGLAYRIWRMIRTVRYYPGIQSWKNKLELPNPGIDWLLNNCPKLPNDRIISISARNTTDWEYLFNKVVHYDNCSIELNVSCPNIISHNGDSDYSNYNYVFEMAVSILNPNSVIVKLPPINYYSNLLLAYNAGIRRFHCCNTLPIAGGREGLSGKGLKPLSIAAIRFIKETFKNVKIIGGGGITLAQDIEDYRNAGANDFAVGSVLFFPWKWSIIKQLAKVENESSRSLEILS